ncbi:MAG: T9SS type A sorting domain-containing protein [Candidatus Krumholzibacteriia bacterium]
MRAALALSAILVAIAPLAAAAVITTDLAGGPWHLPQTWQGGQVPTSDDDVIIDAAVTISTTAACNSLEITPAGTLSGSLVPTSLLQVTTSITNHGNLINGSTGLDVRFGGDAYTTGTWQLRSTEFIGNADATIGHDPAVRLVTSFRTNAAAAGRLLVTTPLEIAGNVDAAGPPLVLQPGCPLTVDSGVVSGEIRAQGNEIRFVSWSYLADCSIDDAVLVGEVEAAFLVHFTTRVTVAGVLQNATVTGGGAATIDGDLVNLGTIRNNSSYGFIVNVTGDVHTDGEIACSQLSLQGVGVTHELSMGPDAVISAHVFLPEFQPAAIVATTPVRFADTVGVGVVGRLELQPGASLTFLDFGGMGQGTLAAAGNEVRIEGAGALSGLTIDRGVLAGPFAVHGDIQATGGLTVTGTLASWPYAAADITVAGLLRNTGTIADGAHPVAVTALGDVGNQGGMTCASLTLAGVDDQTVGVGDGIAVPDVVIRSNLPGPGYQWYRDGVPLPGGTGADLAFVTLGDADLGAYVCIADGQTSRTVTVQRTLDLTDAPAVAGVALAQNRPNPFNPATEIAFALERSGPVRLTVYDVRGRQVAQLVDRTLSAGRHAVTWQPDGLASGLYVYRLEAGGADLTRRCVLLK